MHFMHNLGSFIIVLLSFVIACLVYFLLWLC